MAVLAHLVLLVRILKRADVRLRCRKAPEPTTVQMDPESGTPTATSQEGKEEVEQETFNVFGGGDIACVSGRVYIDVIRGDFFSDIETFGNMDPYVTEHCCTNVSRLSSSLTPTIVLNRYVVAWLEPIVTDEQRKPRGKRDGSRTDTSSTLCVNGGGKTPAWGEEHNPHLAVQVRFPSCINFHHGINLVD